MAPHQMRRGVRVSRCREPSTPVATAIQKAIPTAEKRTDSRLPTIAGRRKAPA